MTHLHLALGLLAVAANAVAAAWGTLVVLRRRRSPAFLPIARAAQGITLARVLLGVLVLSGAGEDPPDGSHLLPAAGVIAALGAADALGRLPARRQSSRDHAGGAAVAVRGEGPALASDASPGVAQTAILAAGFVVVSGAAVLALMTGWR
jgi:hypothetical protein